MDLEEEEKPSEERLREALEDTPSDEIDRFVVACPMCVTMYEDGRKTGGYEDDIEIVDLTELLVEATE
jgi:Fe-S oxidoreductase